MKLSITIITKNEAENLAACLKSAAFADQIVVVDSGSSDNSVEIAKSFGATVVQTTDWPGFGPQKNRAVDAAKNEWIFALDADERITDKLKLEIEQILKLENPKPAYYVPRITNFCGTWIRHSGWYPDYTVRLFKKSAARYTDDLVHESVRVAKADCGFLNSPMLHYSIRSPYVYLRKLSQYSMLGAEQSIKMGRRSSVSKAIAFATIDFTRMYVWRRGFLDGRAGLIIALLSAESMFHKWLGIALLRDNKGIGEVEAPRDLRT